MTTWKLGAMSLAMGAIGLVVAVLALLRGQENFSNQEQLAIEIQGLTERLETQTRDLDQVRAQLASPTFTGMPERMVGITERLGLVEKELAGRIDLPVGTILAWDPVVRDELGRPTGAIRVLPEGWVRCDGTRGTPNLVGLFLRGDELAGVRGGRDTVESGMVAGGIDLNEHRHASPIVESGEHTFRPSRDVPFGTLPGAFTHPLYTEGQIEFIATNAHWILTGPAHGTDLNRHTHEVRVVPSHYTVIYIMKVAPSLRDLP